MKACCYLLTVLLGASYLTVSVAFAVQEPPRRPLDIEGRILPAPGETSLPRMVIIHLVASGSAYDETQMVQQNGSFQFRSIPYANYDLTVEADGYVTVRTKLYERESQGGTRRVDLSLGPRERAGDELAAEAGDVVTAKTFNIPKEALREVEKAQKAQKKNNLEKALDHLNRAVEIHPDFSQAYNNIAAIYLKMNRRDEAEAAFLKSIEIDPDAKAARKNLGFIYLTTGREEEAAASLKKAAELDPSDAETYAFLGEALYQSREFQAARAALEQAIQLDPELFRATFRLGYVCIELKDYPEALKAFQQFLKTNQGMDTSKVESLVAQLEEAVHQQQR
jgi:tetratricopeptide (TPR) repeat protein